MCVLFVAWRVRDGAPLVVASNRDERYDRPTMPLTMWADCPGTLAGRDLESGGTWLGVNRRATVRWAAVTNVRAPEWLEQQRRRSRGWLVRDYLCGDEPPAAYAARVAAERERYGGFNLLVGDLDGLWYVSSRPDAPRRLEPGYYGLSNAALDPPVDADEAPWPKVARGGAAFRAWVESNPGTGLELDEATGFALLHDPTPAPDDALPDTGVGLDAERTLSAVFIRGEDYGTVASTLLTVGDDGEGVMVELSPLPDLWTGLPSDEWDAIRYPFRISAVGLPSQEV